MTATGDLIQRLLIFIDDSVLNFDLMLKIVINIARMGTKGASVPNDRRATPQCRVIIAQNVNQR